MPGFANLVPTYARFRAADLAQKRGTVPRIGVAPARLRWQGAGRVTGFVHEVLVRRTVPNGTNFKDTVLYNLKLMPGATRTRGSASD